MARAKIKPRRPKPAEDIPPPPGTPERITWGKLKLRYLPLKERIKFVKPDDEDEG